jgi:hypothetical protein
LIYFGMGPRKSPDGDLVLALPLGGVKLPGIAAEDIGKCAYGVFRRGRDTVGQRFGIAGEVLSGPEMAAKMARAIGRNIRFEDVPFDVYRGLGFPGADDLGNMFSTTGDAGRRIPAQPQPGARALGQPQLLRSMLARPQLRTACQSDDRWFGDWLPERPSCSRAIGAVLHRDQPPADPHPGIVRLRSLP